jgi:hypothetical protein
MGLGDENHASQGPQAGIRPFLRAVSTAQRVLPTIDYGEL